MEKPAIVDRKTLISILLEMADRVSKNDSFDGSIEYHYWDEENGAGQNEFSVIGCYRIGNAEGQGGMIIINTDEKVKLIN